MKCLYCELPVYCKKICRRHYKKQNALKNGTYKKLYERHKSDPVYMEKKRMWDRLYIEKKKAGLVTSRENPNTLINQDWKAYHKQWRENNIGYKKMIALKSSLYDKKGECKLKAIDYYSHGTNTCLWCKIGDLRVLELDHINDDGKLDRSIHGDIVRWVTRNNFPEGYQVLCRNCNWIKELARRTKQFEKTNFLP